MKFSLEDYAGTYYRYVFYMYPQRSFGTKDYFNVVTEAERWCRKNLKGKWVRNTQVSIEIDDLTEAAAFRLRWC